MLITDEWMGFASERKTLRVSSPQGIQRSTYFVSMPARYGIFIMIIFALEHWLASETTFVIRILLFSDVNFSFASETQANFSLAPGLIGKTALSLQ